MLYKLEITRDGLPMLKMRGQGTDEMGNNDYADIALMEGKTFKFVRMDDRGGALVVQVMPAKENERGLPDVGQPVTNYDSMNVPDLATLAAQRGLNPYLSSNGAQKQMASKSSIVKMLRVDDQNKAQLSMSNA